jgi:hypothetical protein
VLFNFHILGISHSCFVISHFLWSKIYFVWLKSFKIYWVLFYGQSFLIHVHVRKIYILLLLSGIFYRCLLALVLFTFSVSFLMFFLVLSIVESEDWNFQLLFSSYLSLQFCQFMFHIFWNSIFRHSSFNSDAQYGQDFMYVNIIDN